MRSIKDRHSQCAVYYGRQDVLPNVMSSSCEPQRFGKRLYSELVNVPLKYRLLEVDWSI